MSTDVEDETIEEMKKTNMNYVPHLKINGIVFHGELTPPNIFEAICASFVTSP